MFLPPLRKSGSFKRSNNLIYNKMEKQVIYLFNGVEVPEGLYDEIKSYCNLNNCPYRVNVNAEKMCVTNVFRVMKNLQIETFNFAKFLIDLYQRKKLYFQKCVENEII